MENSKIRITNTKYSLNSLTEGIELCELPLFLHRKMIIAHSRKIDYGFNSVIKTFSNKIDIKY